MSVTISTVNVGIAANDGTGDDVRDAFIKVNNSLSNLKIGVDSTVLGQANTTFAKVANLQVTNQVIGNLFLTGSDTIYINGSPVTTAGNAFTGGNVSGLASFTNTADSSSPTSGALTIVGGLGIGKKLYVGDIGVFTGNIVATSITDSSSTTTGSIVSLGGLGIAKSAKIGQTLAVADATTLSSTLSVTGVTTILSTTVSTNIGTGALKVSGGIGIGGNLNAGGTSHTLSGNLTVAGNLQVNGNLSFGTDTFRINDNIIDLHTDADNNPLTIDDGKDVGLKFHVYKSGYGDYHAFAGWANDSGAFEYYDCGTEIGGVFVGNTYGTFKGGGLLSVNATPSTSTTTGAIVTSGGIGAAGNIYAGGAVVITGNTSAGNVSATKGIFTSVAGTLLTAAQPNITSVGTLSSLTVNSGGLNAVTTTTATVNATSGNIGTLAVTTGLSTANAVVTGGSINNATIGDTTHTTGRFTTVTATTVNAGTIGNTGATLTGTLSTTAQPNITSVGTLTSLAVTNATTVGNLVTTNGVFWANGTAFASSLYSNANVTSYLPTYSGNIGGTVTGNQPYITGLTGLTGLSVTGNVTATNVIISDIGGVFWSNGATALGGSGGGYGNTNVGQYLPTYSGSLGGTLTTASQTGITSVGTLTGLTVTGSTNLQGTTAGTLNSTSGNITTLSAGNFSTANAVITGGSLNNTPIGTGTASTGRFTTLTATGATTVNSVTSSGTIIASTVNAGTIGNTGATLTGTLNTPAQPNITSVGTLTGLNVSGNVSVGNLTVTGTTVTINSTTLDVADLNVTLAKGAANPTAANGAGITIDGANATLTYGSVDDEWRMNKPLDITGGGVYAVGYSYLANVSTANAVVTGGSINNTPIGATIASTGRFTTVIATTVNAGTIGNTGAVINGTLSAATLANITTVGSLTSLTMTGNIAPSANGVYNLGSTVAWWNNVYANTFRGTAITAQYADLAEIYIADANYKPGTVVVFGGSAEITISNEFADASVAGVISTNPAYLMNSDTDGLPVALRGRVPVHVIGPVKKGDLLVTSDSPGYAASVGKNANYGPAVFAKALQDKDDNDVGTIEAVII